MNELETLEKLKELCEHIEKNSWQHLYSNIEVLEQLNHDIEELNAKCDNHDEIIRKVITDLNNCDEIIRKVITDLNNYDETT